MQRRSGITGSLVVAALVAALMVLSASCQGSKEASTVTIGVIGDLSGTLAAYGTDTLQGAQIAIDEINQAGGINGKKVLVRVYDEKNDPVEAVKIAQQVGDECLVVVVGSGSSPALAIGPYLEKAGIPFVVTVSSNPKITGSGWKWVNRVQLSDRDQVERIVEYASSTLGIKKFAVLHDTSDLGVGARDAAKEAISRRGLELTTVESWRQSDVDFSSQLLNAKRSGAQAVIVWGAAEGGARIVQQAKKLNVDLQLFGGNPFGNQRFLDLAGEAADGTIVTWGAVNPDIPKAAELARKMRERYNRQLDVFVAQAYDAVHVLAQGIEAGKSDRAAIQAAVRAGTYDGAVGKFKFDETGHNVRHISVAKVVGGRFQIIE